jgi:autotransporter translocation and assembly factor TamB
MPGRVFVRGHGLDSEWRGRLAITGTTAAPDIAGKYVAPGVSVGVTQGISPPTSKVTVEVEVRPHLTVQGEAGQTGGTGIGLNYNYDY